MNREQEIEQNLEQNLVQEFKQAVSFLDAIPQYKALTGVERSAALLQELGNPQDSLRIIHIAGTNGKGSVCAYLDGILQAHGYHTGMFTSPHLVDIRERIRIDGACIDKETFCRMLKKVQIAKQKLHDRGIELAYFDYLLGIAMCAYAQAQVDFVIMETGLGGRLDATNAVQNPILSVITTISLDHMNLLGDTVEQIAKEKAGIIKRHIPVVYSCKENAVKKVIEDTALKHQTKVVPVHKNTYQIEKNTGKYIDFSLHNGYYKNNCFTIATGAVYQAENCAIALTAAAVLQEIGQVKLNAETVSQAVKQVHWAGRMEEVLSGVYVDGAHNPEGIEALIETTRQLRNGRHCILLFSVVKDKNFHQMIQTLCTCGLFEAFIVTEISGDRKLGTKTIQQEFEKYTDRPVYEFHAIDEAFTFGLTQMKELFVCTGSLYLVGEIKCITSSMLAAE